MSRHQEKSANPLKYSWLACLFAAALAPAVLHAHPSTEIPGERPLSSTPEELRGCRKPIWPQHALRTGQKGEVTVAFLLDVDGKVIDSVVRKSSKYVLLDESAKESIKDCRFKPRTINGNPASAWLLVTYRWVLLPMWGVDEPTTAMVRFRREALSGDLEAFYQLALSYRSEFNDYAQAMTMLREAAEHGHPGAIYEVADGMWHGREMPMDQSKALSYYMSAAQLGHAESQYEIGAAYADGIGVARNEAKAVPWFIKAAEQGNLYAQVALADLLAKGVGGAPDYQAAANWYRKAAEGGDDLGQRKLAQCYLIGKGVDRDAAQAVFWLRKAVEQRQPKAEAILAVLYLQGEGVPVDNGEALKLLRRSAAGGDAGAMILLGDLLAKGERTGADPAEAAIWYRRAADRGDAIAMRRISTAAATPELAREWLQKAQQADLMKLRGE
jgi:TonB family protein